MFEKILKKFFAFFFVIVDNFERTLSFINLIHISVANNYQAGIREVWP